MTTTPNATDAATGSEGQEYNVIWFTEACISNAKRLQDYVKDAQQNGNAELAEFFQKAQAESRKGADLGKQMLRTLLREDTTS